MRGQRPRRRRHTSAARPWPCPLPASTSKHRDQVCARTAPSGRCDELCGTPTGPKPMVRPGMRAQLQVTLLPGRDRVCARTAALPMGSGARRGCPSRPWNGWPSDLRPFMRHHRVSRARLNMRDVPRRTRLESARSAATVYASAQRYDSVSPCDRVGERGATSYARSTRWSWPGPHHSLCRSPRPVMRAQAHDLTSVNTHRDHLCVDNTPSASQMSPGRRVQPQDGLRPCHRGG